MPAYPGFASRLFVSGMASFVLIGILGAAYGVALPAFTRQHDLGPGAASLILTVHSTGGVLAVLAATAGVPGLGARTALALMAAGAALIALAPVWSLTLAGGFVAGAGFGLIATHVNRMFLTGFGPRGPGMVGLVNAVSGVGLIAGPLVFLWVGGVPALLFGGIAVFSAVLIPVFAADAADLPDGPRGLPNMLQPKMGILVLNLLSVCLEAAIAGLGVSALIVLGRGEGEAATLASVFFAAFLVSRLSLYWLTRLAGPAYLFLIGTIGTAAAAGLAALGWHATGYVLSGLFIGMAFPSFYVWGARVLGPDPRMSAAMLLAGLSGGAVGPLVFGAVLAVTGLEWLFATVAVLALLLSLAIALSIAPARGKIARQE